MPPEPMSRMNDDKHKEREVFVTCRGGACFKGAIYVPEVGPMGDEFCTTVEEARATGIHWRYDEHAGIGGGFLCPNCDEQHV
jgi:hypothetical protein